MKRHFRLWNASLDLASYVPFRDPVTGRWWHWVPSYHDGMEFKHFVEGMGLIAQKRQEGSDYIRQLMADRERND